MFKNSWHPPPPRWIKLNVDASPLQNNQAGIAEVIRDHKGIFIMDFGKKLILWDSPLLELLAAVAIKDELNDWMFDYQGLISEGDNVNIMKKLQRSVEKIRWICKDILANYLSSLYGFNKFLFHFVSRDCNKGQFLMGDESTLSASKDEIVIPGHYHEIRIGSDFKFFDILQKREQIKPLRIEVSYEVGLEHEYKEEVAAFHEVDYEAESQTEGAIFLELEE
ncbi:hypothetical protein M5K25_011047 [Dendrobium thyrsiflorum]|uniref:Uncharacterized protein n=1 Tax=Dendrobium thyrsiflorum TaxID=117978 RepID=A0ABD0V918_DENTH